MAIASRPTHRDEFEIAIICALEDEFNAVEALFDEFWEENGEEIYGKAPGDPNAYSTGRIGQHNVVLAFMPGIGKAASASVAASFRSSFTAIKLGLVVGICGGVPVANGQDIVLGDVVISTGIVEFDFGRQVPNAFVRKDTLEDSLGRPSAEIRAFLQKIKGLRGRTQLGNSLARYLQDLLSTQGFEKSRFPGVTNDKLFEPGYRHKHQNPITCGICAKCETMDDSICPAALKATCLEAGCNFHNLVTREAQISQTSLNKTELEARQVQIHFGLIASGDTVMKSGRHRDEIAAVENVIAFEMEGAGVWDQFQTIVIKGVCDYADSHKSKDWQRYAAATAGACMKAFLKMWQATDQPSWRVNGIKREEQTNYNLGLVLAEAPEIDETTFVGRQEELDAMAKNLIPHTDRPDQKCLILSGLGGIGKTQLAIQFAKQFRHKFSAVFWLKANSESTLRQSLVKMAKYVFTRPTSDFAQSETKNEKQAIEQIRAWLSNSNNSKWLLIFDNHDCPVVPGKTAHDSYNVKAYFPHTTQGSILVTTRRPRLAFGTVLSLKKLESLSQGVDILARRSGRENAKEDAEAERLAERLDGLPLALATAGDYLRQIPISFTEYLRYYEESWDELESAAEELPEYEDRTLYSTWNLSSQRLSLEAANLLKLMAYFDNQDIWFELLRAGAPEGPWWLQQITENKIRFSSIMKNLQDYSLVDAHHDLEAYSLHRCLHDWTLDHLNKRGNVELCTTALHAVASMINLEKQQDDWRTEMRLEPHALRLGSPKTRKLLQSIDGISDDMSRIGMILRHRSCISEAIEVYQWVLASEDAQNNPNSGWTLGNVTNLGILYSNQGRLEEAEAMFQRCFKAHMEERGPDDAATHRAMNNLGQVFKSQGNSKDAEAMYRQTLAAMEKTATHHEYDLPYLNTLGNLASAVQDEAEAEKLLEKVLIGHEKVLGTKHRWTLRIMHNLGRRYLVRERFADAEDMLRKTLTGKEEILGPFHRTTLHTMEALGSLYEVQGKLRDAERLYERARAGYRRLFGNDHQMTLEADQALIRIQQLQ